MPLPVFFSAEITGDSDQHVLNEETSRHIVQVLRMEKNEQIQVTNGKGYMFLASILDGHKKGVSIQILDKEFHEQSNDVSIAISLIKNVQRFEWFLEKAVEIGISEIYPLICARTEKHHFRASRMEGIITSAMLQSQQSWLPLLHEPQTFSEFMSKPTKGSAFIAHCVSQQNRKSLQEVGEFNNPVMLIGPEGDFTSEEISMALRNNYQPVTLGQTRLRTETAGVVAITLLNTFNAHPRD